MHTRSFPRKWYWQLFFIICVWVYRCGIIRSLSFIRKWFVSFPVRQPNTIWINLTSVCVATYSIDTSSTRSCVISLLLSMQYNRSNRNANKYKITFRPVFLPIFGSRFRIPKFIFLSFGFIIILHNVRNVFLDDIVVDKPIVDHFHIALSDKVFDQLLSLPFRQLGQSELLQTNQQQQQRKMSNFEQIMMSNHENKIYKLGGNGSNFNESIRIFFLVFNLHCRVFTLFPFCFWWSPTIMIGLFRFPFVGA